MLSSVWRSRKVAEATPNDSEPVPMYLLSELQKISRESSDAPAHLGDALIRRLSHKNPNISMKALRVIKELCTGGAPEFRRYMQRNASAVREQTSFRAPPDPLRGEKPNQMVREAAK
eukprot:CAMPEP_0177613428 /NCGR_PEP_ID=MMETSP0419_2-20121207/21957_1 /TAXON_ID=582737 /ORGANISM="Tetraselmis sp., Strain GSL018" /LENGTH=116 /DNA_ID=CAMNT_0019110099 /DNA_START=196 /DNA_END=543 /DNA_ORIENTATION=-